MAGFCRPRGRELEEREGVTGCEEDGYIVIQPDVITVTHLFMYTVSRQSMIPPMTTPIATPIATASRTPETVIIIRQTRRQSATNQSFSWVKVVRNADCKYFVEIVVALIAKFVKISQYVSK